MEFNNSINNGRESVDFDQEIELKDEEIIEVRSDLDDKIENTPEKDKDGNKES
jgi:hypothetical protein